MDMLYFGDSMSYPYQGPYKQGLPGYGGEFGSSCAYQGVPGVPGLGDMAACRYSSLPAMSSYGMYAFQQANCANIFARKAGRIKGNVSVNVRAWHVRKRRHLNVACTFYGVYCNANN